MFADILADRGVPRDRILIEPQAMNTAQNIAYSRRLLLSRMVVDHRVSVSDPFQLTENATQRAITDHLLGERAVGMAEVGELLSAA